MYYIIEILNGFVYFSKKIFIVLFSSLARNTYFEEEDKKSPQICILVRFDSDTEEFCV